MAEGYLYILASRRDGSLYTGATTDLSMRVAEHRSKGRVGFANMRDIWKLVHLERYATIEEAIAREKRVKKWKRAWKVALVEKDNPEWTEIRPDY